jgi:predicted  nucleic acid-binding Zn-ribbon protein
MDYEQKYNDLLYEYRKLQRKYEELENDYRKLDLELDSANNKIRRELEPRIQAEKRAYDRWITNPERMGG